MVESTLTPEANNSSLVLIHVTIFNKKFVCLRCGRKFASIFTLSFWKHCCKILFLINNPRNNRFSNLTAAVIISRSHRCMLTKCNKILVFFLVLIFILYMSEYDKFTQLNAAFDNLSEKSSTCHDYVIKLVSITQGQLCILRIN